MALNNTAILILGAGRSGTSATAGVLLRLGVDLGPNLLKGTAANPRGYFEHEEVTRINNELLTAIGYEWDDPRAMPDGWSTDPRITPYRDKLQKIIERDFQDSALWGLKDPRLCRLLPLWIPLLTTLAVDLRVILIIRHPAEVAASLPALRSIGRERRSLIWLRHNLEAERNTRNMQRTSLDYHNLLQNWQQELLRIGQDLGIDWPIAPAAAAASIQTFLEPQLQHHFAATASDIITPVYRPWVQIVYQSVRDLNTDRSRQDLDQINQDMHIFDQKSTAFLERSYMAEEEAQRYLTERNELLQAQAKAQQQLQQELGTAHTELAIAKAQQQQLQQELGTAHTELAQAKAQQQQLQQELGTAHTELAQAKAQQQHLQQELGTTSTNRDNLQNEVSRLLRSRSWRLTSPLRLAFSLGRSFFRRPH